MPKRERSPHCPGRLYAKYAQQGRPPRCPCLWTECIVNQTFKSILIHDPDLGYSLTRLLRLFSE